jgi:hypothetical protein
MTNEEMIQSVLTRQQWTLALLALLCTLVIGKGIIVLWYIHRTSGLINEGTRAWKAANIVNDITAKDKNRTAAAVGDIKQALIDGTVEAGKKAESAATAAVDTKQTMEQHYRDLSDKIDKTAKIAEQTHVLVNGAMTAQLKKNLELAQKVGDPAVVEQAEKALKLHEESLRRSKNITGDKGPLP